MISLRYIPNYWICPCVFAVWSFDFLFFIQSNECRMAWWVVWEYRDVRWEEQLGKREILNKTKNSISRRLVSYKEKEREKETTKILYGKIKSFMDISLTLFSYGYMHIYTNIFWNKALWKFKWKSEKQRNKVPVEEAVGNLEILLNLSGCQNSFMKPFMFTEPALNLSPQHQKQVQKQKMSAIRFISSPLYVTTHDCSYHTNINSQCSHYALCLKPATLTTAQDASNSKKKKKGGVIPVP